MNRRTFMAAVGAALAAAGLPAIAEASRSLTETVKEPALYEIGAVWYFDGVGEVGRVTYVDPNRRMVHATVLPPEEYSGGYPVFKSKMTPGITGIDISYDRGIVTVSA